jgi:DNA-binding NarL/FixJ family response regulator
MTPKIIVAIVEDKDDIRNSLQMLINSSSQCGCEHVYADAESALEEIPYREPDVVLMDIQLPGMSGIECIRQIKGINGKIQFMMMTVYEDTENIFKSLEAGASGYLLKNTSPKKILEAITELYEGGSPMSGEIARKVVSSFSKVQTSGKADDETKKLTPREFEIVELLSKGFLYKEIADQLNITVGTVKQHIHNTYEKLQVNNRTEAINKVLKPR